MRYDLQYHIRTLDGTVLITDVDELAIDDDEDVKQVIDEIMGVLFNRNRVYISFEEQRRRVYVNPASIVTITPWYKEKS